MVCDAEVSRICFRLYFLRFSIIHEISFARCRWVMLIVGLCVTDYNLIWTKLLRLAPGSSISLSV